jgi:hypothetical protein
MMALESEIRADEVLRELESGAAQLAAHGLPYLAYLTLQFYTGECAEETKAARFRRAQIFLDYSRFQPTPVSRGYA